MVMDSENESSEIESGNYMSVKKQVAAVSAATVSTMSLLATTSAALEINFSLMDSNKDLPKCIHSFSEL